MKRVRDWVKSEKTGYEKTKTFWRGERIEWLLASGFHTWFFREIEQGRVLWPSTTVIPSLPHSTLKVDDGPN